jgi:hypothetical protein
MANPYFRQVPNFSYVSRLNDAKKISQYVDVKNFFRRAKLRPDINGKIEFFDTYVILGDERPDNVAYKFYNDPTLDWVVLISNNILNIQTEWPLSQRNFDTYLLEKYGSYENIYSTHHHETKEVKNSAGTVILPAKLKVDSSYQITFYDTSISGYTTITDCVNEITNYQYEEEINNSKREIFILKSEYLRIVFDDIENIMTYKKGSTQYVSETLKKGNNIRLFE